MGTTKNQWMDPKVCQSMSKMVFKVFLFKKQWVIDAWSWCKKHDWGEEGKDQVEFGSLIQYTFILVKTEPGPLRSPPLPSVMFFTSTFTSTEVPLFLISREVLYMVATISLRPSIWHLSWVKFQVWFAI